MSTQVEDARTLFCMIVYEIDIPIADEAIWEDRLALAEPVALAMTHLDGLTLALEATFEEDTPAYLLQAAFGGKVRAVDIQATCDGWEGLPAKIGKRFLVALSEESSDHSRVHLHFPSREGVFDGAQHPSTLTVLRMLVALAEEDHLSPSGDCLDVGCGNGILGITAGLLGARRVRGFDLCQEAITCARSRAIHYHLADKSHWHCCDLAHFQTDRRYDLVIANLYSELLEKSFESLGQWLAPGGTLIVSGVLERFAKQVFLAAGKQNLFVIERCQRGPWVSARLQAEMTFH